MPKELIFRVNSPFRLILIQEEALRALLVHRQIAPAATEAGGVLLGTSRGPHYEVTMVTAPQPEDLRSRFSFVRCGRTHRRLAVDEWRKSHRLNGYLGEWHSHPVTSPMPSLTDQHGWRKLAIELHTPLFHLIVGISSVKLWFYDAHGSAQEGLLLEIA